MTQKNIYNRLADEIQTNKYLEHLYDKLVRMYTRIILLSEDCTQNSLLSEKEFNDLMRFADILSCSNYDWARNKALKILAFIIELKKDDVTIFFAKGIFAKLGHFIGLANYPVSNLLPIEREIELGLKEIEQRVPNNPELHFTDGQFELFNKLINSHGLSFSGPTSMGKTFIIKNYIRKLLIEEKGLNIIIIVPTKALINQLLVDFHSDLSGELKQYKYELSANPELIDKRNCGNIFILTQERLDVLLSSKTLGRIDYLFIDEAHKMGEISERGLKLYNGTVRVKTLFPSACIFFAYPNIINPEELPRFLGVNDSEAFHRTRETPVSQNLYYINLKEDLVTYLESDTKISVKSEGLPKTALHYIHNLTKHKNTGNLIYINASTQIIDKCISFINILETNNNYKLSEEIIHFIEEIKKTVHPNYYLIDFLKHGVGYHTGNMPPFIRNRIEELFSENKIKYLFCTSTLLEGVNLPAVDLFILNQKRHGVTHFTPIEFWNLAGRAGRL